MSTICYLGLFLPLLGFLGIVASAKKISRNAAGIVASSTVFISFCCFISILYVYAENEMNPQSFTLYQWIPIEKINADFVLTIDPLSLVMTLIITGIGFLIHVYSIGYMEHDEDFARYFAFLNFFIFSMLLLVLAGNVLLLFVGWEGVGLASYLLIGFWYHRPSAAQAATKAFVVNRVGDVAFLLALLLTFVLFGTGNILEISERARNEFAVGAPAITILTLLYFFGATGKSAQIPLHVWLADAMEGPTPVSALIHAATMVTAGVYLVVRLHEVFILAPATLHVMSLIGGITSLAAALWAIGQTDLKRILAYSTVSQLGLMFLACGVTAYYAAMFHLITHAFMKALLFLAAGNVIHMMHGTTDLNKMGGLKDHFKYTHWLFLIGVLAMSGIPPLSAFFSKDLILEQEHLKGYDAFFYTALATSILTAFYLTRGYCLAFLGHSKLDDKILKAIYEAPSIMLTPVAILGILSVIGGFLGFAFRQRPLLEQFLAKINVTVAVAEEPGEYIYSFDTIIAFIGALSGIGLAVYLYTKKDRNISSLAFLKKAFYIDELYDWVFVKPLSLISNFISYFIEPYFFEKSIAVTSEGSHSVATWFQKMQSGQIRSYVAWMSIGTLIVILYLIT